MPEPSRPPFIQENIPLADQTTIGLGGTARWFAACHTEGELRACLSYATQTGLPLQVFSGGSNIVFADEGFDGLVLKVALRGIRLDASGDHVTITASAGEAWDPFVSQTVEQGWGGLECLSGIPGSIGATPVQNVGAYGQEVAETIQSVRVMERRTFRTLELRAAECGFAYRQSRFKREDADCFVITEVRFRLKPNAPADIRYSELRSAIEATLDLGSLLPGRTALRAVREAVIGLRRKKSMVVDPADANSRSVGSFFTNPFLSEEQFHRMELRWRSSGGAGPIPSYPGTGGAKIAAAWLVEHAGFPKGYVRGGAGISSHHSLALINRGGTTADLLALADEIQAGVARTFGIQLEREPIVVPFKR